MDWVVDMTNHISEHKYNTNTNIIYIVPPATDDVKNEKEQSEKTNS